MGRVALGLLLAAGIVNAALAQPGRWPEKPIRMIVPLPAGAARRREFVGGHGPPDF